MNYLPKLDADEARSLVEEVWRENTLNGTITQGDSALGRLMANALMVLSRQLYDKETHFLLELIQNADDNTYDCAIPSLDFTYRRGSLRVDCNEIGFTESNVRAICKIGESTKVGLGQSTRYIGEKGIGFKSVFKVASVVYISSGNFSFKFDQSQLVGIIAPVWSDFPEPTLPGYTSFYLQLFEDCDEDQFAYDIRHLDLTMLIFLKQLRQINLNFILDDGQVQTRRLWREDLLAGGSVVTRLHGGTSSSDYLVVNHLLAQLPVEKDRLGIQATEVLLAFPQSTGTREGVTQSVYAYLPIRNYGFKFMIQGDFLLTANREDVLDIPWNHALRDSCVDAFVKGVYRMNSGPERYTWPRFIPAQSVGGFFEPLRALILKRLPRERILEGCSRKMISPATLTRVPRTYCSDDGVPFTLSSSTLDSYLSAKYPEWVSPLLSIIGVRTMDADDFLRDLKQMISNDRQGFRRKHPGWHSQLAQTLLSLWNEKGDSDIIKDLNIIPLSNGEWVSANTGPIYFNQASGISIPETVPIHTVDRNIEKDHFRRNLFVQLGVKPRPDAAEVCRIIIGMHQKSSFKPARLKHSQLVEHVTYMFNASFEVPRGIDLWFVTADDKRVKGSLLYMQSTVKVRSFEDRISEHIERNYDLLHDVYAEAFPSHGPAGHTWRKWMQRSFGIQPSNLPRICTKTPGKSKEGTFDLSDEFTSLLKACDSSDILELLKVNWQKYSRYILDIRLVKNKDIENPVKEKIAAARVKCYPRKGAKTPSFHRLRDTLLPLLDRTMDAVPELPILDIPNPSDQGWKVLEIFGVSVYRNIDYYFRCLQELRTSIVSPPKATVAYIYERIQADFLDNKDEIRKAFMNQRLLYTSLGSSDDDGPQMRWIDDDGPQMRWIDAKECLEKNLDIVAEYQGSATLFRNVLGFKTDDIKRLIQAFNAISDQASLADILKSFVKMDQAMQTQSTENFSDIVTKLNTWVAVFPILTEYDDKEYHSLAPLNPAFPPWFIADRHHLRDSFCGHVNLLAFWPQDLQSIETFLKALGLESRYLSKIVKFESQVLGKPKVHKAYTVSLRRKAEFITALIPKQRPQRDALVKELFRVEVYTATEILQKYTFTYGGRSFSGTDVQGGVSVSESNGRLQIFITRDHISEPLPPPELANEICDRCGIIDSSHRYLVHFALCEHNRDRLSSAFVREGVHVLDSSTNGADTGLAALWRDEFLDTRASDDEDEDEDSPTAKLESKFKHIPGNLEDSFEKEDRRLPLQYFKWSERILFRNSSGDPASDYRTVLRMEPAHEKYIAEVLTSRFLQRELGDSYKPNEHWTSPQRYKAGFSKFSEPMASYATFTVHSREASRKLSGFLAENGFEEAKSWAWTASDPTYHLDLAVTSGGAKSDFSWTTQQFLRMRRFRTDQPQDGKWKQENIHILVRISDVFTTPRFDFFVDPWRLFTSERFSLQDNWTFTATILDTSHDNHGAPANSTSSFARDHTLRLPQSPPSLSVPQISSHSPGASSSSPSADFYSTPISSPGSAGHHLPQHSDFGFHTPLQSAWNCQNQSFNNEGAHQFTHPWQDALMYQQMQALYAVQSNLPPYISSQLDLPNNYQLPATLQQNFGMNHGGLDTDSHSWSNSGYPASHNLANAHGHLSNMSLHSAQPSSNLSTKPVSITIPTINAETRSEFSYETLNKGDIRLLMLHPGCGETQLQAVVYRSPLLLANSFQAISYAWGSSELSHKLWTPDGDIKITASLDAALRCLRHEKQPMVFWADGVCINQNDNKEKAEQIRLLPQVFQRATCVVVCLGSDSNGDRAMETLMQIRVHDVLAMVGEEWPKDLPMVPKSWKKSHMPPQNDPIWFEIGALFERPWFKRAWIIQEVVVATSVRVVCGKWMIDWNDLLTTIDIITRESQDLLEQPFELAQQKWRRFSTLAKLREREARHDRRSLLELLEDFRDFKSLIDHDRFFCLLGLAIDGNNTEFVLDYDLSFDVVVSSYAWAFIHQGKAIELLHRAGVGSRRTNTWPSWIPDWTIMKPNSLRMLSLSKIPYAASRHTQPRFEDTSTKNSSELRLYGIEVDEIMIISKSSNTAEELDSYLNEVDNMVCSSSPQLGEDLKWKIPIAGSPRCQQEEAEMKDSYTALRMYLATKSANTTTSKETVTQRVSGEENLDSNDMKGSLWAQGQKYYLALQESLTGWRCVTTKRQFVGIVPPGADKGDIVSIIDGGVVPFLLRKDKALEGSYLLVGECYIHGLMKGEAGELGLPERIISLR